MIVMTITLLMGNQDAITNTFRPSVGLFKDLHA